MPTTVVLEPPCLELPPQPTAAGQTLRNTAQAIVDRLVHAALARLNAVASGGRASLTPTVDAARTERGDNQLVAQLLTDARAAGAGAPGSADRVRESFRPVVNDIAAAWLRLDEAAAPTSPSADSALKLLVCALTLIDLSDDELAALDVPSGSFP